MNIYVASSWRNTYQPQIVERLREEGHEVYDFKHPSPGDNGFHWSDVDPEWKAWNVERYIEGLGHPLASQGFAKDMKAMLWAGACVLVLPCGRSAHLEAGWFIGKGRPVYIFIPGKIEPELMYLMAGAQIYDSIDQLCDAIDA